MIGSAIAPGVPDITSMRGLIEMGYEVHPDGAWWPEYDWAAYDAGDSIYHGRKARIQRIHHQWNRIGVKYYLSIDEKHEKRVMVDSSTQIITARTVNENRKSE